MREEFPTQPELAQVRSLRSLLYTALLTQFQVPSEVLENRWLMH